MKPVEFKGRNVGREYTTIFLNEASEIDCAAYVKLKTRLAQRTQGSKNRIHIHENQPSSKHWIKGMVPALADLSDNIELS